MAQKDNDLVQRKVNSSDKNHREGRSSNLWRSAWHISGVDALANWATRFPWYYKAKMTSKEVKPNKYQSSFDVTNIRVSKASRWNVQPGRFPNLWFLFCPFRSGRSTRHEQQINIRLLSVRSFFTKVLFLGGESFLPVRLSPCSYAFPVRITSRNTVRREMYLNKLYGQSGAWARDIQHGSDPYATL